MRITPMRTVGRVFPASKPETVKQEKPVEKAAKNTSKTPQETGKKVSNTSRKGT